MQAPGILFPLPGREFTFFPWHLEFRSRKRTDAECFGTSLLVIWVPAGVCSPPGMTENLPVWMEEEFRRGSDTWIKNLGQEIKMTEISMSRAVFLVGAELGICIPKLCRRLRGIDCCCQKPRWHQTTFSATGREALL